MRFTEYKVMIKFPNDRLFQTIWKYDSRQQAIDHKSDLLSASVLGLQVKIVSNKSQPKFYLS